MPKRTLQEGTNAFYVELKVVDANGEETREIKEHFEKNGSKAEIFLPFFDYGINPGGREKRQAEVHAYPL